MATNLPLPLLSGGCLDLVSNERSLLDTAPLSLGFRQWAIEKEKENPLALKFSSSPRLGEAEWLCNS